jgi:hypothetical protein
MFTGNYLCTSFKVELLKGVHDFSVGGHVFKLALYNESATLSAATTAYSATDEIPATGGYIAGGVTLSQLAPAADGTTALVSFATATVSGEISARGGLIYNSSVAGNPAVMVLDFGLVRSSVGSVFTVQFPLANADTAILRIS